MKKKAKIFQELNSSTFSYASHSKLTLYQNAIHGAATIEFPRTSYVIFLTQQNYLHGRIISLLMYGTPLFPNNYSCNSTSIDNKKSTPEEVLKVEIAANK